MNEHTSASIVFIIFAVYFIIYKLLFLNSEIYLEIRSKRSKSYLKKHKIGFINSIFYSKFKDDIKLFYYYQNIFIVSLILFCTIFSVLSLMFNIGVVRRIFMLTFPFFYFSLLNWEIESTISQIKSKSIWTKIFVAVFWIVITALILIRIAGVFIERW